LEVGETAAGAGPVTRAWPVLARRERGKDVGSAVKNAVGGWGDLDSFFVQGATVHAKGLSSLDTG